MHTSTLNIFFVPHTTGIELKVKTTLRNEKGVRIKAGKKLALEHRGLWGGSKKWMTGNDEYSLLVNNKLHTIREGLKITYLKMEAQGKQPSPFELIAEYFKETDRPQKSFADLIKEYVEQKGLKDNTARVYNLNMAAITKDFFKKTYGTETVMIRALDLPALYRFEIFLNARRLAKGTRDEYVNKMKALMTYAAALGYIAENPYESYKSGTVKSGQEQKVLPVLARVVSPEDLNKIEITDVPEAYYMIKDFKRVRLLFLLQTWTGFSFADMEIIDLKKTVGIRDLSGTECIVYNRVKTGEQAIIPIHKECRDILNKLEWDIRPQVTYRSYYDRVKALLNFYNCNYEGSGAHTGRHVFGERMIAKGYSMEAVSRMMGHSTIRETEKVYAKIDKTKIIAEYERLQAPAPDNVMKIAN